MPLGEPSKHFTVGPEKWIVHKQAKTSIPLKLSIMTMKKNFRESLKRMRTNRFTKEKWNEANSWESKSINSLKKTQTEVKLERKVLKLKQNGQG